jgi:hypothetical protein
VNSCAPEGYAVPAPLVTTNSRETSLWFITWFTVVCFYVLLYHLCSPNIFKLKKIQCNAPIAYITNSITNIDIVSVTQNTQCIRYMRLRNTRGCMSPLMVWIHKTILKPDTFFIIKVSVLSQKWTVMYLNVIDIDCASFYWILELWRLQNNIFHHLTSQLDTNVDTFLLQVIFIVVIEWQSSWQYRYR